jgi:hypothetical protein
VTHSACKILQAFSMDSYVDSTRSNCGLSRHKDQEDDGLVALRNGNQTLYEPEQFSIEKTLHLSLVT